jgi:hypothetical protein
VFSDFGVQSRRRYSEEIGTDRGISRDDLEDRGEEIDKRITRRIIAWGNNLEG